MLKSIARMFSAFRPKESRLSVGAATTSSKLELYDRLIISRGNNNYIDESATVTFPRSLILGNGITIEADAYLESYGGIYIADNCIIGARCILATRRNSSNSSRLRSQVSFISLGENVTLGIGVVISSGTTIDANINVPDGAVLSGHVTHESLSASYSTYDKQNNEQVSGLISYNYRNRSAIENSMQRLPDAILKGYPGTLNSTEKDPFFVLSTGRAGSETICNLLSQHPEVDCIHEPKDALIRLSDGYFHGLLTEDQVSAELRTIYTEISCFPNNVYGESDQKLSNLALLLSQILPNAKFVWLIREPVNTVLSTFSRGWFSDEELLMNESEEFYKSGLYRRQYSDFRPQASLCGDMPESEWRAMTMFERNCWYWYRWNLEIKNQLDKIDNSRWIQIKTEDINQEYSRLLDFLGVENLTLDATVSNKARTGQYALLGRNDLTPEMRASLDKWCLNSDLYTK